MASAGANLTGSRIAVLAVLGVGIAAPIGRRAGWRRAALIIAAVVLGLVLSVPGDSTTTTSRTADDAGSGVGTRTEMWGHGVDAWLDRPLTGWGPGRFREATAPRITETFAVDEGPDKLFFDAHNGGIEMLTTTGLLGVVAIGAFTALAAWRARGALAWMAAAIAVTWVAEPISITAASMAMLALGAAHRPGANRPAVADTVAGTEGPTPRVHPVRAVALTGGALVGLLVAGAMVWAGTNMLQASEQADLGAVRDAQRVYRRDSAVTDLGSLILYGDYGVDQSPETLAALRASTELAVDRDPTYHLWWVRLGTVQRMQGDLDESRASFAAALDRNPWSISAWYGMRETAERLGDDALVAEADAKLCILSTDFCE